MRLRRQASTDRPISFRLFSSADHLGAVIGATPTVQLSKNGGAFAAAAGAVSEIGNGWYQLAANAVDRSTLGDLVITATAAGADTYEERFAIVAYDPFDTRLGLTGIPTAAPGAAGGLPVIGTGAGAINPSGGNMPANVVQIAGQTASAAAPVAFPAAIGTSTFSGGAVASVSAPVTVGTNQDKTGYALAVAPPTAADNATAVWSAGSRTLSAFSFGVTVTTNNDKTGYALSTAPPTAAAIATAVWANSTRTLSAFGFTPNATVAGYAAGQDPATLLDARFDAIDTTLATVAGFSAALATIQGKTDLLSPDVATFATRGLSLLVADGSAWQLSANALELAPAGGGGAGGLSPEQEAKLDAIAAKTALITAGSFTVLSPIERDGDTIRATAGDAWQIDFAGLGSLADVAEMWLAIKRRRDDSDSAALLLVSMGAGLATIAGDIATAADGVLTIEDAAAGNVRAAIEEAASLQVCAGSHVWALKIRTTGNQARTLASGAFIVRPASIEAF